MGNIITANELKTKGVSILKKATEKNNEAIISVRGKNKYVVLPFKYYNRLRECELEAALIETKADLKKGRIIRESVKSHMKRIKRG